MTTSHTVGCWLCGSHNRIDWLQGPGGVCFPVCQVCRDYSIRTRCAREAREELIRTRLEELDNEGSQ